MIYHAVVDAPTYADMPHGTFADLQVAVDMAVDALIDRQGRFDVIAVQGTSGMSIGFPVTLELQRRGWQGKIVVVRKPDEDSHQSYAGSSLVTGLKYNETLEGLRCLFLDDFVSEGATRRRVREAVEKTKGTLVAQYTSRDDAFQAL